MTGRGKGKGSSQFSVLSSQFLVSRRRFLTHGFPVATGDESSVSSIVAWKI